jgi:hypothetical protein
MRRVVVLEWKLVGGDVRATSRIVAVTLRTGGATLGSGARGGGSVGIGGTIGRGAGAGVGAVAGIVGELLSQSCEGVMMGTLGDAGMSEGSLMGGSVGTRSGLCVCC